MYTTRVEDLIRDALIAAKRMGMGRVDFDLAVERVKADSLAWDAMQDSKGVAVHLVDIIAQRNQRLAEQRCAEWVKKAHDA